MNLNPRVDVNCERKRGWMDRKPDTYIASFLSRCDKDVRKADFSNQFRKFIINCEGTGYTIPGSTYQILNQRSLAEH